MISILSFCKIDTDGIIRKPHAYKLPVSGIYIYKPTLPKIIGWTFRLLLPALPTLPQHFLSKKNLMRQRRTLLFTPPNDKNTTNV